MINIHFIEKQSLTPLLFQKIVELCKVAETDPASKHQAHCFSTDWENTGASVLYQVYHGLMNLVYVEGEQDFDNTGKITSWKAMCGYSFHGDILFAPRRAYVTQSARRNIVISINIMPELEKIAIKNGIKFIVTSFNDNPRGKVHFNIYHNRKFLKFKSKSDYMFDFISLSGDPLLIMGVPQYVIYKSLTGELLTVEKTELLLRP
jgi:hypothetical protein